MPRADHRKRTRQNTGDRPITCSKACMGELYAAESRKGCRACGNPLRRARGSAYCSTECKAIGAARPRPRTLPEAGCQRCGIVFRPKSSRQAYCSRPCANEAHALRMIGPGNSRYKDGESYAKLFRSMRPLVMERDSRRCVACKAPESFKTVVRLGREHHRTTFHVHHINEDPKDNRPQNLVTLCDNCHAVHHKSNTTPWPWFAQYAADASASMTSKLRERATSLLARY